MSGTRTRGHGRITGRTDARALRARGGTCGCGRRSPAARLARGWWSPARPAIWSRSWWTTRAGSTLVSASTLEASVRGSEGDKTAKAKQVGALLAERASAAGITAVIFDRGGHAYHGRVAALADSAREGGLGL